MSHADSSERGVSPPSPVYSRSARESVEDDGGAVTRTASPNGRTLNSSTTTSNPNDQETIASVRTAVKQFQAIIEDTSGLDAAEAARRLAAEREALEKLKREEEERRREAELQRKKAERAELIRKKQEEERRLEEERQRLADAAEAEMQRREEAFLQSEEAERQRLAELELERERLAKEAEMEKIRRQQEEEAAAEKERERQETLRREKEAADKIARELAEERQKERQKLERLRQEAEERQRALEEEQKKRDAERRAQQERLAAEEAALAEERWRVNEELILSERRLEESRRLQESMERSQRLALEEDRRNHEAAARALQREREEAMRLEQVRLAAERERNRIYAAFEDDRLMCIASALESRQLIEDEAMRTLSALHVVLRESREVLVKDELDRVLTARKAEHDQRLLEEQRAAEERLRLEEEAILKRIDEDRRAAERRIEERHAAERVKEMERQMAMDAARAAEEEKLRRMERKLAEEHALVETKRQGEMRRALQEREALRQRTEAKASHIKERSERLVQEQRRLATAKEAARIREVHADERNLLISTTLAGRAVIVEEAMGGLAAIGLRMADEGNTIKHAHIKAALERRRQMEEEQHRHVIHAMAVSRRADESFDTSQFEHSASRRREDEASLHLQLLHDQQEREREIELAREEQHAMALQKEQERRDALAAVHEQEMLLAAQLKQQIAAVEAAQQRKALIEEERRRELAAKEKEIALITDRVMAVADGRARDFESFVQRDAEDMRKQLTQYSRLVRDQQLKEIEQTSGLVHQIVEEQARQLLETATERRSLEEVKHALAARQQQLADAKAQLILDGHHDVLKKVATNSGLTATDSSSHRVEGNGGGRNGRRLLSPARDNTVGSSSAAAEDLVDAETARMKRALAANFANTVVARSPQSPLRNQQPSLFTAVGSTRKGVRHDGDDSMLMGSLPSPIVVRGANGIQPSAAAATAGAVRPTASMRSNTTTASDVYHEDDGDDAPILPTQLRGRSQGLSVSPRRGGSSQQHRGGGMIQRGGRRDAPSSESIYTTVSKSTVAGSAAVYHEGDEDDEAPFTLKDAAHKLQIPLSTLVRCNPSHAAVSSPSGGLFSHAALPSASGGAQFILFPIAGTSIITLPTRDHALPLAAIAGRHGVTVAVLLEGSPAVHRMLVSQNLSSSANASHKGDLVVGPNVTLGIPAYAIKRLSTPTRDRADSLNNAYGAGEDAASLTSTAFDGDAVYRAQERRRSDIEANYNPTAYAPATNANANNGHAQQRADTKGASHGAVSKPYAADTFENVSNLSRGLAEEDSQAERIQQQQRAEEESTAFEAGDAPAEEDWSVAELPSSLSETIAKPLPLSGGGVAQPQDVATDQQLASLDGEAMQRIRNAGAGHVPNKGHIAVRFSPFVLKKRHIGVLYEDEKGSFSSSPSRDGNKGGGGSSRRTSMNNPLQTFITVGAATFGQRFRGVPMERLDVNDIEIMVESLAFDDAILTQAPISSTSVLSILPKKIVEGSAAVLSPLTNVLEDFVGNTFGGAYRKRVILDEHGNRTVLGCSFFLFRRKDGKMLEFVCANSAERMEWLAWFAYVLRRRPVDASQLMEKAREEVRKIRSSAPSSPVRRRGSSASPMAASREGGNATMMVNGGGVARAIGFNPTGNVSSHPIPMAPLEASSSPKPQDAYARSNSANGGGGYGNPPSTATDRSEAVASTRPPPTASTAAAYGYPPQQQQQQQRYESNTAMSATVGSTSRSLLPEVANAASVPTANPHTQRSATAPTNSARAQQQPQHVMRGQPTTAAAPPQQPSSHYQQQEQQQQYYTQQPATKKTCATDPSPPLVFYNRDATANVMSSRTNEDCHDAYVYAQHYQQQQRAAAPRSPKALQQALLSTLPPPLYPSFMVQLAEVPLYSASAALVAGGGRRGVSDDGLNYSTYSLVDAEAVSIAFDGYCLVRHPSLPGGSVYGRLVLVSGGLGDLLTPYGQHYDPLSSSAMGRARDNNNSTITLSLFKAIAQQRQVKAGVDLMLPIAVLAGYYHPFSPPPPAAQQQQARFNTSNAIAAPSRSSHSPCDLLLWPRQLDGNSAGGLDVRDIMAGGGVGDASSNQHARSSYASSSTFEVEGSDGFVTMLQQCRVLAEPFQVTFMSTRDLVKAVDALTGTSP